MSEAKEHEERFVLEPWHDEDEPCDDDMETEGCCFPDKCIMGGMHLKSECCTAEMMEQIYEDGKA